MEKSKAETMASPRLTVPEVERADVEVVATARRRQFSGSEKRRILDAADRCTEPGEIGALLRKEGIYSSHLNTWRKQRAAAGRAALEPQPRGRKADPAQAEDRRVARLTEENDRLRRKLAQANAIIDVQKKLCALLGMPSDGTPGEPC
jgi:transposase-like protein